MNLPPRVLALGLTFTLACICAPQAPAFGADPKATLGVYAGAAAVTRVGEWEKALDGTGTVRVMDFLDGSSWAKIEDPDWWVRTWAASPYSARLVYSVPLLPETGGTLAEGAAGLYDEHFRKLAELLVAKGQGGVTLRLGWEFNGGWYRWRAAADPEGFIAYWRAIVDTMRAVPGAAFKFDWCPNISKDEIAPDAVYPGDAYVDYVGMDVYDQGWGTNWQEPAARWSKMVTEPYGLNWQAEFAAAHDKQLSLPEWGLSIRPDGHGGGDDPYYVQHIGEWISTHDFAYSIYFDQDNPGVALHTLGNFPTASAVFAEVFGGALPAKSPSVPVTEVSGGSEAEPVETEPVEVEPVETSSSGAAPSVSPPLKAALSPTLVSATSAAQSLRAVPRARTSRAPCSRCAAHAHAKKRPPKKRSRKRRRKPRRTLV